MKKNLGLEILCIFVLLFLSAHSAAIERLSSTKIPAFAEECEKQKNPMNLVTQFGSDFSHLASGNGVFRGYHHVGCTTVLNNEHFTMSYPIKAQFGSPKLSGAKFSSGSLQTAILEQTDFTRANPSKTYFKDDNVKSALFINVKGLDIETGSGLKEVSKRSGHKTQEVVWRFLRLLYWPTYSLVLPLVLILGIKTYNDLRSYPLYLLTCIGNILAVIPLLLISVLFVLGTNVARQSAGLESLATAVWILWSKLWPLFFFGTMAGIPITFFLMIYFIIKRRSLSTNLEARY